jgi:hypothetical protein
VTGSRAGHPGPHPEPSPAFSSRSLPIESFRVEWYRIYRCALDPLFFGRTGSYRFDAPAGEFGVALFDRAEPDVQIQPDGTLLTDAVLLAQLLRRYHIGLID